MQSNEFQAYFNHYPNFQSNFKGVFPIDKLPNSIKYRHFLIVNTDVSTGPGEHWIGLVKTKKHTIEIFDSLGVTSKKKKKYLKYFQKLKNIQFLDVNKTQFQANDSISCGKFVLYYIFKRAFNLDLSYKKFLQISFKKLGQENEALVIRYCENLLK